MYLGITPVISLLNQATQSVTQATLSILAQIHSMVGYRSRIIRIRKWWFTNFKSNLKVLSYFLPFQIHKNKHHIYEQSCVVVILRAELSHIKWLWFLPIICITFFFFKKNFYCALPLSPYSFIYIIMNLKCLALY